MKVLILILKQIRRLYIRNMLFCLIFVISFLTCSIILVFMYGYYINRMKANIAENMDRRRITVVFSNKINDYPLIDKMLSVYTSDIEEIRITCDSVFLENDAAENNPLKINIVSYMPEYKNNVITKGRTFTEQEKKNGENVIITSQLLFDNNNEYFNKINAVVNINNSDFRIIGVSSYAVSQPNQAVVNMPYNSIKKLNVPYIEVSLVLSQKLYMSFDQKIKAVLDDQYIDTYKVIRVPYKKSEESQFIQSILEVIFIVVLAIINMMMIYKYLMNIRAKEYAIMRMIGASESSVVGIMLTELLLILTLVFILAVIVNKLVLVPLYRVSELIISYKAMDYVILFLILYCFACIPVIPVIYRNVTLSPAKNKQVNE